MKSPKKPSAAKDSAGAACEICRNLEDEIYVDHIAGQSFPSAVGRLKECGYVLRCPLCHTFYLMADESDTHHYMSAESSLTRIDNTQAFRELASMRGKEAKKWMDKLGADDEIPKLIAKLESAEAADAAAILAGIYFQRGDWDELEALLRHPESPVRAGALGAVEYSLAETPGEIIDAVATLLADEDNAGAAHDAFCETAYGNKVSPLITTLAACFDHKNPKVRALAVDSVIHHMELDSGFYIDSGGDGSYRTPKPLKFGKVAKKLYSRLPQLIGHMVKPRSARWEKIESMPRSDNARDFPNKLNTRIGASEILNALINQSSAGKARVREAFEAQRAQLRKMSSKGASADLNFEVSILVGEVMREEGK